MIALLSLAFAGFADHHAKIHGDQVVWTSRYWNHDLRPIELNQTLTNEVLSIDGGILVPADAPERIIPRYPMVTLVTREAYEDGSGSWGVPTADVRLQRFHVDDGVFVPDGHDVAVVDRRVIGLGVTRAQRRRFEDEARDRGIRSMRPVFLGDPSTLKSGLRGAIHHDSVLNAPFVWALSGFGVLLLAALPLGYRALERGARRERAEAYIRREFR